MDAALTCLHYVHHLRFALMAPSTLRPITRIGLPHRKLQDELLDTCFQRTTTHPA